MFVLFICKQSTTTASSARPLVRCLSYSFASNQQPTFDFGHRGVCSIHLQSINNIRNYHRFWIRGVCSIHLQAINNVPFFFSPAASGVCSIHLQAINNRNVSVQIWCSGVCSIHLQAINNLSFMSMLEIIGVCSIHLQAINNTLFVIKLIVSFLQVFFAGNSCSRNGYQSSRDVKFHLPDPFLFEFLGGGYPDVADQFVL